MGVGNRRSLRKETQSETWVGGRYLWTPCLLLTNHWGESLNSLHPWGLLKSEGSPRCGTFSGKREESWANWDARAVLLAVTDGPLLPP